MIALVIGMFIGAAILGLIIAVMDEGEFPGWMPMIACLLALVIPTAAVNVFLPPEWSVVGLLVGAVCAGFAISALCDMSLGRATTAVSIYLAIRFVVGLLFSFLIQS